MVVSFVEEGLRVVGGVRRSCREVPLPGEFSLGGMEFGFELVRVGFGVGVFLELCFLSCRLFVFLTHFIEFILFICGIKLIIECHKVFELFNLKVY